MPLRVPLAFGRGDEWLEGLIRIAVLFELSLK